MPISIPIRSIISMLSLPIAPAILDERSSLELCEGDPKLFLGIHHDGTVPGDGLADRLARDEQKPHTFRLGGDSDLVAVTEEHQVTVPDQAFTLHVEVVPTHGFIAVRVLLLAKHALAANHVRKHRVTPWRSVGERRAGGEADVEVLGARDDVAHWPGHAARGPGDHLDRGAPWIGHARDLGARHAAVARRHHLVRGRQVRPELEAVHGPALVTVGHLLVDDAAAGGHPLHIARGDHARVAEAVAVLDRAAQHVGDGLHPAVGMPWEPVRILVGIVGTEIVEEKERNVLLRGTEADRTMEMDACTFDGGATLEHLAYTSGFWHAFLLHNTHTCPDTALLVWTHPT